jgi:hypothetical protein
MIGLSWRYGESRDPAGHRVRAMIPVISWESKTRMVPLGKWRLPPVAVREPTVIATRTAPQVKCQINGIAPGKGILKPAARR